MPLPAGARSIASGATPAAATSKPPRASACSIATCVPSSCGRAAGRDGARDDEERRPGAAVTLDGRDRGTVANARGLSTTWASTRAVAWPEGAEPSTTPVGVSA